MSQESTGFVFVYTPAAVDLVPAHLVLPVAVLGVFPGPDEAAAYGRRYMVEKSETEGVPVFPFLTDFAVEQVTVPPTADSSSPLFAVVLLGPDSSWEMSPQLSPDPPPSGLTGPLGAVDGRAFYLVEGPREGRVTSRP